MNPDKNNKETAQAILKARFNPDLLVDGWIGDDTMADARKWIGWHFKGAPTPDRWVAAVIQKDAQMRGINAGKWDAYFGPQTDDASDRIQEILTGKPLFGRPDEGLGLEAADGISNIRCWNPTTNQIRAKYGNEGTNQAMVASPYPLRLDWDLETVVSRFSAHASLKSRFELAMRDVLATYGLPKIKELGLDRFGGCLNVRLKRGGSTPSTHSWGIAVDWFPSANSLKETKRTARFARPEYFAFMEIWERHGFMSLGRCFDFDFMHLQANP